MAPTLSKSEKAVTRHDNNITAKATVKYAPTFKPRPKSKRKAARKSKATTGLESQPKFACVTPELIKALNHMALGFTLVSDRKLIRDFFRYHRYRLTKEADIAATEL